MNAKIRTFAGLTLAAALGAGPAAGRGAAAQNAIRAIEVSERGGAVELEIQGSRSPSYTVFKLHDPPRLVVDLAGADLSAVSSPISVGKGGVIGVTTAQYQDQKSSVGRVILTLDVAARYEVAPRGESVVVRIAKGDASSVHPEPSGSAAAVDSSPVRRESSGNREAVSVRPKAQVAKAEPAATSSVRPERSAPGGSAESRGGTTTATAPPTSTPTQKAEPAPEKTALASAPAAGARDDSVVSRRLDELRVKRAASAVTGVQARGGRVEIQGNGQFARFEVIELRNPPRLAIDLYGVQKAPRAAAAGGAGFKQVRFGKDDGKVRVVLDAEDAMPRYEVRRTTHGLAVLRVSATASVRPEIPVAKGETATASVRPEVRVAKVEPVATSSVRPERSAPEGSAESRGGALAQTATRAVAQIRDLRFTQSGGVARIDVAGKVPHTVSRPDGRTLVLSLEGAQLPKRFERSLDTSAFNGPVTMVSSFNQPSTGQVKIIATLKGEVQDKLVETSKGLSWTVAAGAAPRHDPSESVVVSEPAVAEAKAAGFAAEAPSYAATGAPQRREYTGRRITLDFHDIEIRNLLRLIADVSKKNIVVADDVSGKVTVSLRNVPWDQALDLILKTKGLGKEEMGNVIRVAKYEQIAKEQAALAEAAKARAPLIPLKVRLIPVNFAQAKEIDKQVKDVLTERGSVTVDERTNVLIVKDTQEALARAEGLVRNLDTETPQVLIESRIIEASSNFNEQIGVQWGGNASFTQATGNPTGLAFPNNVTTTGAAGGGPTQGVAANPNFAVNLPAAIGQGSGGGLGFVFGSAGGAFNLNLRLSALENRGVVKTISAPKIATIDNKEATIGQGLSIPFSQVSASGVNTVFIEAKLELKVTPHVTADGSILMKIKATNNQPNPALTGANGQPSISKREAETSVLVKDGDTTVIGGIYTRATSNQAASVPFFGKIPILGFFFRSTTESDDHTELLIFITPRILNRATTALATGN